MKQEGGTPSKFRWEPKKGSGWVSLALTLKVLDELSPLRMRGAAKAVAEVREGRGAPITERMAWLHLNYALRAGYAEVVTLEGVPCYRLTEKGAEFLKKTLGI